MSQSLRYILAGAGLGILSSEFLKTILNGFIANFVSQANSLGGDALSVLSLCGFDTAISVCLSAIITRITIQSLSTSIVKNPT